MRLSTKLIVKVPVFVIVKVFLTGSSARSEHRSIERARATIDGRATSDEHNRHDAARDVPCSGNGLYPEIVCSRGRDHLGDVPGPDEGEVFSDEDGLRIGDCIERVDQEVMYHVAVNPLDIVFVPLL